MQISVSTFGKYNSIKSYWLACNEASSVEKKKKRKMRGIEIKNQLVLFNEIEKKKDDH